MDYMRVVLNSFTWKRTSSPFFANKKIFRQTLADPMFCWLRLVRKTLMCDDRKFVPGVCSLVTLHSVAAAPKHLRFALRCWSLLTFIRRNYSMYYIPKVLRKGNPVHGPFAQLSYTSILPTLMHTNAEVSLI